MSKVLVTGGAGYLGSVLVTCLIQEGYSVKVYDKFLFGKQSLERVKDRIEIIQGDIRNFNKEILDDVSYIIHLAAFSNDPMAYYDKEANRQINVGGTKILAEAAAQKENIKIFLYSSSASIYDKGIKAGGEEIQTEESSVDPKLPYSISKYEGERVLLEIMKEHPKFCPVILRQGTLYGHSPRMRFDLVVNTFVRDAFTKGKLRVFCGGTQWRPLADVFDTARAYIEFIKYPNPEEMRGEIFNIVEGNYQVWDIAHRVKWALKDIVNVGVEIDYSEFGIDRSYKISGKKLEDRLGFRYKNKIESAAEKIALNIKRGEYGSDLNNSIYTNIEWIEYLKKIENLIKDLGGQVF
ncbi:MAG: SDR family oxidoreductase [Candidatus Pacearchaeota archaeon]